MPVVHKVARAPRLIDERCRTAGSHQAMTTARVILGHNRPTRVTRLCIFCNRWELKWEEVQ